MYIYINNIIQYNLPDWAVRGVDHEYSIPASLIKFCSLSDREIGFAL